MYKHIVARYMDLIFGGMKLMVQRTRGSSITWKEARKGRSNGEA